MAKMMKNYRLLLSARIAATGMVDAKKLGPANAGCHIPVQTVLVDSAQMVRTHGLIFQLKTTLPIILPPAPTRDTVTLITGCVFAEKVSLETLARDSCALWTRMASNVLEMDIA